MKTTKQILSVGMAILTIFIALYLVFGIAAPALSATLSAFVAAAGTPTPPPGDEIPLKPIEDLTSLNATINLDVNGLINGERAQGDLTALLTTNDQGETQITVTGSLLGDIAAQVGGSIVGLFTPSKVDIYKVPEGTYIVVNGLFPLCIKPKSTKATAALEELSPQSLLSMVTSSDVARGEFIGEGKLNGKSVKHYVLNGDAFLAAAQKSHNSKLRSFSKSLWDAEDADLYVDSPSGYPVAFRGSYSGTYEPLEFEGDFEMQIELTGINTNTAVNLPSSCNKPISR